MLEFAMAAGLMRLPPALRFKSADNLRAVHVCNYTHLSSTVIVKFVYPKGTKNEAQIAPTGNGTVFRVSVHHLRVVFPGWGK
jgi:hypothetical protein